MGYGTVVEALRAALCLLAPETTALDVLFLSRSVQGIPYSLAAISGGAWDTVQKRMEKTGLKRTKAIKHSTTKTCQWYHWRVSAGKKY